MGEVLCAAGRKGENMKHTVQIKHLPTKEYLVIKGYGKLYDPGVAGDNEDLIRKRIADGSVERLKKAACSETVYVLFCNTCVRNDEDKCYDCGYDIACENHGGKRKMFLTPYLNEIYF